MLAVHRIRVAIVDTGVSGNALSRPRLCQVAPRVRGDGRVTIRSQAPRDEFGHGTICAAIVLSVAPDVELCSVSVLGKDGEADLIDLAAAVQWCALEQIDVASISLGTPDSAGESLRPVCEFAQERGVALVASSPVRGRAYFPAALTGVISVGAAALLDGQIEYHPGQDPEFTAAGASLTVTDKKKSRTFGGGSGSSYAVPRVAGRVALVKQQLPDADLASIRKALVAQAAAPEAIP